MEEFWEMEMKVVIDTSVLIEHLRSGRTSPVLFDKLEKLKVKPFIPTIVIFELFCGKSAINPSVVSKITNLIQDFKRIELTEEIAIQAGKLYRGIGPQISPQDYIIAASALDLGATVVTLNRKHFEQIPGLVIYGDLS